MKKHKGEIIELATRNSGYTLKQIAQRMGISRSTLYNRFEDMDVNDDFILDLASVIHHDFSKEFPHLKDNTRFKEAQEDFTPYQGTDHTELLNLQKIYCQLLEAHSRLIKIAIRIANAKDHDLVKLQKEIVSFIKQNMN